MTSSSELVFHWIEKMKMMFLYS